MTTFRAQKERAGRDVRTSLLLDRIANAEAVHATKKKSSAKSITAKADREPIAALRMVEKDGMDRIASRIRTDKTLNLLFENARKTVPAETPALEETGSNV
ncbi:MAG: hypothetical protein WKF37_24235 [Bryobacteraceae bacterium]